MINIQDGNHIYNKVNKPAAVFDLDTGTLYKIGESEDIFAYYEEVQHVYEESCLFDMADNLIFIELPKDQDLIDKIFQNSGFIKKWYQKNFINIPGLH